MSEALGPEFQTSNLATAYPFIRQIDTPADLHTLFADAMIWCRHDQMNDGDNLFLYTLDIDGLNSTTEIRDQDGNTFFASGTADRASTYGTWLILEWVDDDIVVKYLLDSNAVGNFAPYPVTALDAEFTARVVQRDPQCIQNIITNSVYYAGEIRLTEGYNVQLKDAGARTLGNETFKKIEISGVPGAGLGRYPLCETPIRLVKYVNSAGPDDHGNFYMDGDSCYFLSPEYGSPNWHMEESSPGLDYIPTTPSKLIINNVCEACCKCSDFVEAYDRIRQVLERGRSVSTHITQIRADYDRGRTLMMQEKTAREGITGNLEVRGSPGFFIESITYIINSTNDVITVDDNTGVLTWYVSFNPNTGQQIELPQASIQLYTDQNGWQNVHADAAVNNGVYPRELTLTLAQQILATRVLAIAAKIYINGADGDAITVNLQCQAGGTAINVTDSDDLEEGFTPSI